MKNRTLLLALLLLLMLPLARALSPTEDSSEDKHAITVRGTILSELNKRNRQKGIPDEWKVDITGDGTFDLILYGPRQELPGSEFAHPGMHFEAKIKLLEIRQREYHLIRWIKMGMLP